MITEYHRPDTLEQALALLSRSEPKTVPLGGGAQLSRSAVDDVAVVDLQLLGLDYIRSDNHHVIIGACTPLQKVMECELIPGRLREVLKNEYSANLRGQATLGGCISAGDGRSSFLTGLLGLNAELVWLPGEREISVGDFLALRQTWPSGQMIREVRIPSNANLAFEGVARSLADRPVLCVAVGRWSSGRTRVALGGTGKSPILAMDGPEAAGAELAVKDALLHADDAWASAEYRMAVGTQIVRRLLASLKAR